MQSFFRLIDHLNGVPAAQRPRVEELIWDTFGVERAILVLDMSHFSLSVRRSGILTYLALIRAMHVTTEPVVRECRGEVIKYEADNLMAAFGEAADAVEAAVRINRALPGARLPQDAQQLAVGIGIDHGRFLMVPGQDCYGDTVNVAYKLGEDLAGPGEVLISAAVRDRLGPRPQYPMREQSVSISGLDFTAYSVQYAGARAACRSG